MVCGVTMGITWNTRNRVACTTPKAAVGGGGPRTGLSADDHETRSQSRYTAGTGSKEPPLAFQATPVPRVCVLVTKRHDRGCRNPEERDVLERAAQRSIKTTGLSFQQPSLPPDPLCLPRCRQLHSLQSSLLPFGCGSVETFDGLLQSSRRALMCTGKAAIATPPDWHTNKEPYRAHWGISKLESGAKKLRLTS